MDPLKGSRWSAPETVAGFVQSPPNQVLLDFAVRERAGPDPRWALDLGCGAGRNAVPLARLGWRVIGLDLSAPMLDAAAARARAEQVEASIHLSLAPMDALPVADRSIGFIVAHGVWNLARSGAEFQRAVGEAGRVARPGAGLFVFTFSRNTLAATAVPVPGESFVYTEFSGEPQCFVTEAELLEALARAGFGPDPAVPLRELNRPERGRVGCGAPVIYEGAFRRR